MQETAELAAYLDEVVARALDDEGPRRSARIGTTGRVAPERRGVVYRAARKAYRLANRPQLAVNDQLRSELSALQGQHAALRVELSTTGAAIASVELAVANLTELGERVLAALDRLGVELPVASDERLDQLYDDFEREFRGSFEDVASRLEVYLDYLWPLADSGAPVLDIGCGRGEWLSLLRRHAIGSYGVDVNAEFVEACRARGLDAQLADAFAHLPTIPTGSIGVITAFHLVEHLDTRRLLELVDEAARALRSGGCLILETPNPTNLSVGAASFYRDPTHRRPVHPEFLAFLVRDCGFAEAELRYLHPNEAVEVEGDPAQLRGLVDHVKWALFGPQDYAVIATKPLVD